jgi:type VI secretion system secreted protein VgrG
MPLTSAASSENRLIDLETPLGKGVLVAETLTGTESLGRLFEYELVALSDDGNIAFDKLLAQHVTVAIETAEGGERRLIDGRVAQVSQLGPARDKLHRYRLLLRAWPWTLTRTADCKTFQDKTVREIIEDIFADHGITHFQFSLTRSYDKRNYCVQYRETDFDFISRLMEEEGIYYFFKHEQGQHTMMLCDDSLSAHTSLGSFAFRPFGSTAGDGHDRVRDFSITREVRPGRAVLTDYDFQHPTRDFDHRKVEIANEYEHADGAHEVFDYPGEFVDPKEGVGMRMAEGERLVKARLNELQLTREVIEGTCDIRALHSGSLFSMTEYDRADQNREYLVMTTHIEARNNALTSSGDAGSAYQCRFTLIPATEQFRTPRTTPKPVMRGPQTAVVVGPSGEEIHVDKWARVKVQFHWDRYGKHDDKSSCWVRVSQIWAGKNFGWMTVPRIGQEVVVSFLEGDPDQPLITGRVFNAEQMPNWALPANKTQSGLLTRSSPGGSGANANELRFEDKKGSEQVYLHAEKNYDISVENDETHTVGHDRKKTIDHDETTLVKHDRTETVDNNETITVHGMRTETVDKNETITIHQNRVEQVDLNETITIGANRTETVNKNETVTVTMTRTHTVGINDALSVGAAHEITVGGLQAISVGAMQNVEIGANQSVSVGRNQSTDVGKNVSLQIGEDNAVKIGKNDTLDVGESRTAKVAKDDSLKVGKNLVIDAGDTVTLKTGSASITMKKDGTIVIKGKDVKIEGSGKINVKASSDVAIKGSKVGIN